MCIRQKKKKKKKTGETHSEKTNVKNKNMEECQHLRHRAKVLKKGVRDMSMEKKEGARAGPQGVCRAECELYSNDREATEAI